MICQNCGAQIEDGAKFCTNCGRPMQQAAQSYVQSAPQQQAAQSHAQNAPQPQAVREQQVYTPPPQPYDAQPQQPYGAPAGGFYSGIPAEGGAKKSRGPVIVLALVACAALGLLVVGVLLLTGIIGGGGSDGGALASAGRSARTPRTAASADTAQTEQETSSRYAEPLELTVETYAVSATLPYGGKQEEAAFVRYDIVRVKGGGSNLQSQLEMYESYSKSSATSFLTGSAQSLYNKFNDGKPAVHTSIKTVHIERADEVVLSFYEESTMDMGDIYPITIYNERCIDVPTGHLLEIEDIVTDMDGFYAALEKEMEADRYFGNLPSDVDPIEITREAIDYKMQAFTLTNTGLRLLYGEYEFGYGQGNSNMSIVVPFAGNENIFEEKYAASANPDDVPATRVGREEKAVENKSLMELCEEEDVILFKFSDITGVFGADDGRYVEIESDGYYTLYDEAGEALSRGSLLATEEGLEMLDYVNATEEDEKRYDYGVLGLIRIEEADVLLIETHGDEAVAFSRSELPAEEGSGEDLLQQLADTWYFNGEEGTASIVFDTTGGFIAYYASGAEEMRGSYEITESTEDYLVGKMQASTAYFFSMEREGDRWKLSILGNPYYKLDE